MNRQKQFLAIMFSSTPHNHDDNLRLLEKRLDNDVIVEMVNRSIDNQYGRNKLYQSEYYENEVSWDNILNRHYLNRVNFTKIQQNNRKILIKMYFNQKMAKNA